MLWLRRLLCKHDRSGVGLERRGSGPVYYFTWCTKCYKRWIIK